MRFKWSIFSVNAQCFLCDLECVGCSAGHRGANWNSSWSQHQTQLPLEYQHMVIDHWSTPDSEPAYRCFGLFGKQLDIYSWAGWGRWHRWHPPILGIPSPSSRWVPLTRDRHQQMESQPTPWENPTQALLYIYQDYIVSKLQSSFQGFCGRPSHQIHLFRHDTALSLLAPGNLAIWTQHCLSSHLAIWQFGGNLNLGMIPEQYWDNIAGQPLGRPGHIWIYNMYQKTFLNVFVL